MNLDEEQNFILTVGRFTTVLEIGKISSPQSDEELNTGLKQLYKDFLDNYKAGKNKTFK